MVAKRIIPCLDVKEGRTVKGVNFEGLRDVGDAVELGRHYAEEGADELVYLDISATTSRLRLVAAFRRLTTRHACWMRGPTRFPSILPPSGIPN